jgi:hypothetical protein
VLLFLYRLALKLGIWNVEDPGGLADKMSWQQLERWMAVFLLEPWGDEWLRDAVLMSQNYNVNRPKGKAALSPYEFMPVQKRQQTQAEMMAILERVPR